MIAADRERAEDQWQEHCSDRKEQEGVHRAHGEVACGKGH